MLFSAVLPVCPVLQVSKLSVERSSEIVHPALLYSLLWIVQRIQNGWYIPSSHCSCQKFELEDNAYRTICEREHLPAFTSTSVAYSAHPLWRELRSPSVPCRQSSRSTTSAVSQASLSHWALNCNLRDPHSLASRTARSRLQQPEAAKFPRTRTIIVITSIGLPVIASLSHEINRFLPSSAGLSPISCNALYFTLAMNW
ncbi:uncharacterized protein BDW70DRAFT_33146 [Aspergillus foveolatus]|uniref:uncharacterized protein n=1 Tax=Aspergillus foveolatus TaxID=210207 RepID=UPI003CCDE9B7